jgi:hypothetical protein
MPAHDVANCTKPNCFGCKAASVNISPYAMPSRLHPEHRPRGGNNSWEKGIHRLANGDPIHTPEGKVIGLAESSKSEVERSVRARSEAARAGVAPQQPRSRVTVSTME